MAVSEADDEDAAGVSAADDVGAADAALLAALVVSATAADDVLLEALFGVLLSLPHAASVSDAQATIATVATRGKRGADLALGI